MAQCKDCIQEIVCSALIEKGLPWNDGEYPIKQGFPIEKISHLKKRGDRL